MQSHNSLKCILAECSNPALHADKPAQLTNVLYGQKTLSYCHGMNCVYKRGAGFLEVTGPQSSSDRTKKPLCRRLFSHILKGFRSLLEETGNRVFDWGFGSD